MLDEQAEQALVTELKEKHGINRVHKLSVDDATAIYVRMPPSGVWRRFRSQVNDPRKRDEASETLLRSCLLHPSQEQLTTMVDERPGLMDNFGGMVIELAGLGDKGEKKVL